MCRLARWIEQNVGALGELQRVDLSRNGLTQLPDAISRLPELTELIVSHNSLDAIPQSVGLLRKLERFDASHNRLSSLPTALAGLPNLKHVQVLQGNKVSAEDPVLLLLRDRHVHIC